MQHAVFNQDFDFFTARQNMVDGQVRTNKVTDHNLIRALRELPREEFVPQAQAAIAYVDDNLPLGQNRFLLEPMVQARLIQALAIGPDDTVLDVGCASGYSSQLLARIAKSVIGIDSDASLIAEAERIAKKLGAGNTRFVAAPPQDGLGAQAPFNAILVNGALVEPPPALLAQLRDGGRLAMVLRAPKIADRRLAALAPNMAQAMLYQKSGNVVSGRVLFDATSPFLLPPSGNSEFQF